MAFKSDIEIAQENELAKITEIAKKIGIGEDHLELYGNYKAKISADIWEKIKDNKDGKLILVTAITPTPAGEGKTTTTVGLADGMNLIGEKVMVALRELSDLNSAGVKILAISPFSIYTILSAIPVK